MLLIEDERITAWETIVWHPFFKAAFDNDGPLGDSMIELLDKAVSLPNKGENKMDFEFTDEAGDGDTLYLYDAAPHIYGQARIIINVTNGNGVVLTLKDVAALHKALGDHLEANKRKFPREGAVQFAGGEIAVYSPDASDVQPTFLVHDQGKAGWHAEYELEKILGTDWEELVVKDV